MKKLSIVFLAAVSLTAFACKKDGGGPESSSHTSAPAAGGGGDCAAAITKGLDLAKADMAKMPGMDDKMLGKMRDVGIKHCTDDKWSADAIKCMVDAKTEPEAQACYGKLTAEQQASMNKAAMEMATPPAAAGGAAPAGSAAAAAGSGGGGGW